MTQPEKWCCVEPDAKWGEWPLAWIIEAYPGIDRLVRMVKVKSRNAEYIKPIHWICPLKYMEEWCFTIGQLMINLIH